MNKLQNAITNKNIKQLKKLLKTEIFSGTDKKRALRTSVKEGFLDATKLLLKNGVDINTYHSNLLNSAISNGHLKTLKYLISQGANPNTNLDTAFHNAVKANHLDVIKYLLEEINRNFDCSEYITYATSRGYLDMTKYFIENGYIQKNRLSAAFSWGVIKNREEIVKYFLQNKLVDKEDINISLIDAADNYNSLPIMKLLCNYGANIHQNKESVLFRIIIQTQDLNNIKYCVERGCNINIKKRDIFNEITSPLCEAIKADSLNIVKYLIAKGADIHSLEKKIVSESPINYEIYKYLKESGANMHINNKKTLASAIQSDNFKIIKDIINNNSDKNILRVGLVNAIICDNVPILEYVLKKIPKKNKIKINSKLLNYAEFETIKCLIENDIKINSNEIHLTIINHDKLTEYLDSKKVITIEDKFKETTKIRCKKDMNKDNKVKN